MVERWTAVIAQARYVCRNSINPKMLQLDRVQALHIVPFASYMSRSIFDRVCVITWGVSGCCFASVDVWNNRCFLATNKVRPAVSVTEELTVNLPIHRIAHHMISTLSSLLKNHERIVQLFYPC